MRFVPAIGPSHIVDRKWSTTAGSLKSKSPGKGPFLCRNSPVLRTQSRPNSRLQAERTHKAYHRCQQENAFHLKPGGAGNRPSFYAVFVQKRNGSSGRTRTYNPPVNSRMHKPGAHVHSMT